MMWRTERSWLAVTAALAMCVACHSSSGMPDAPAPTPPAPLVAAPIAPAPIFDGAVTALAHAGHSWYAAGSFTHVSQSEAGGLVELNGDGSVATCLGGFDGAVTSIARWQDAVFVGGVFTTYRGAPAGHIAKLDATTCALDTTFDPPDATGFGDVVNALAVSNGAVYAVGVFTTYRGASARGIAKLDVTTGDLDAIFSPPAENGFSASNLAAQIYTLVVASDGSILVGGYLTDYRGVRNSANAIAKLDPATGDLDTTFSPPASNGFDCGIACIPQVFSISTIGTDVYAMGSYYNYRGTPAAALVKLDLATGVLDTTADLAQFTGPPNGLLREIAASSDSLFVTGGYTGYRGQAVSGLVALDRLTGALTQGFDTGGPVPAIAVSADALYAAQTTGVVKYTLATLAPDPSFSSAIPSVFVGSVGVLFPDTALLWVGGGFFMHSGYEIHSLVKLDDQTLQPDLTFSPPGADTGFSIAVGGLGASDTGLFVFSLPTTTYRGASISGVVKLDFATGDVLYDVPINAYAVAVAGSAFYAVDGDQAQIQKYDDSTGTRDPAFQASFASTGFVTLLNGPEALYLCTPEGVTKMDPAVGTVDPNFGGSPSATSSGMSSCALGSDAMFVGSGPSPYQSTIIVNKIDLATGLSDPSFVGPVGMGSHNGSGGTPSVTLLVATQGGVFVGQGDLSLTKLDADTGAVDTSFDPGYTKASVMFSGDVAIDVIAPVEGELLLGGLFTLVGATTGDAQTNFAGIDVTTGATR